jgi:hypothetical protein
MHVLKDVQYMHVVKDVQTLVRVSRLGFRV